MKHRSITTICLLLPLWVMAQAPFHENDEDYIHLLRRYEIRRGSWLREWHTTQMPMIRYAVVQLAQDSSLFRTPADSWNQQYLLYDNWEWSDSTLRKAGLWKRFYRRPAAAYSYNDAHFSLTLNPVLDLQWGMDNELDQPAYLNTRGLSARGVINRKISFYTYMTDTQARFPLYAQQYVDAYRALPGEGYFKDGWRASPTEYDFLTARGYIQFKLLPSIDIQFGQDRNFVGYGKRSLILSDFSAPYLFLKAITRVGPFQYQNLFAEMVADVDIPDGLRPKKYFAYHHLSARISPRFEIGVFESVVFGRQRGFELHYLNPIIFYRFVEQHVGSPDNVVLGGDFRWIPIKNVAVYGQLVIDELIVREVRSRSGWWGNKQAFQLGLHYIDMLGVPNLDLQLEFNWVRPYTYTQDSLELAYTHYRQPLAHPLGANFYEILGCLRYQPWGRLRMELLGFYALKGEDAPGENWGGNILLDNRTRMQEYNNRMAQGIRVQRRFAELRLSYQLHPNYFVELSHRLRHIEHAIQGERTSQFTALGLRVNAVRRRHEF